MSMVIRSSNSGLNSRTTGGIFAAPGVPGAAGAAPRGAAGAVGAVGAAGAGAAAATWVGAAEASAGGAAGSGGVIAAVASVAPVVSAWVAVDDGPQAAKATPSDEASNNPCTVRRFMTSLRRFCGNLAQPVHAR